MDKNGREHERSDDFGFDDFGSDSLANPSLAEFDWQDFNSSLGGDITGDSVWIDVVCEVDGEQPPSTAKELNDAQKIALSIAIKRFTRFGGRTKAAVGGKTDHTGYITFEDFEDGPQREAFLLIYGQALNLFEGKTVGGRNRAVEFFFCFNPDELTFDDASAAISEDIRRDVFRLRVMYEFWLGWYILPAMPFTMAALPAQVEDWASAADGIAGVVMAQVVWQNPSITQSDALQIAKKRLENVGINLLDEDLVQAIKKLRENYILSVQNENLYLTGKNPSQEIEDAQLNPNTSHRAQKNSFWWSRLFSE